MSDGSRRFTDQEVALVLRRASELDEAGPSEASGGGLSLEDLRDIAREVGISPQAIARVVRIVDERADSAGSVTEALGSVRWTGSDRLRSTRVSITPAKGETVIEVVEKAEPRLRRIFYFVPAAWGVMLAERLADEAAASRGPSR